VTAPITNGAALQVKWPNVPYAGAPVSQTFRERWLNANQIGDIAPVGMVEIRRGCFKRFEWNYRAFSTSIWGDFPGALGKGFWYPEWQPLTDWQTLDAVSNIKLDQSFDNNGICTGTILMDNVALVPTTGAADLLYHVIEQGYYSPLRGFVGKGRPDPGIAKTAYFQQLPNAQIRVRQGYGADALVTTFLGLIDDIDTDSVPNQLTITARDFGGVLSDELFFGYAKEKNVTPPVTFAPRSITENSRLVGSSAEASSDDGQHKPGAVLVDDSSGWRSRLHATSDETEWIEIHLPQGKYSNFYVEFAYEGMEGFIGIKPTKQRTPSGGKIDPTVDGINITPNEWYNPNGDITPGSTNGGWAYFDHIRSTPKGSLGPGRKWSFGDGRVFYVGDDTVLRLGFRNLAPVKGGYKAGVTQFKGNRRSFTGAAIGGKYITIDDVSDIVRICLRWAGFKTWEVEQTGVNLLEPYVADTSKSFMDVINVVKDMVGFTFFIAEPRDDDDDQDLGYPIFRNNRVFENQTGKTEFIDDSLLLTDAKVKLSNQDDRGIIRCRGIAKKDGQTVGGDTVRRLMFTYVPPWAGGQSQNQAGVIKPLTHTDEKFTTLADCEWACYLIALQIGLGKYTAVLDLPCNPGIGLDTLQSVIDRVQGLNSRIYITNRTQEMQFGSKGYWTMELGGSLVDTPEVDDVVNDMRKAVARGLSRTGQANWTRKRQPPAIDLLTNYRDA
jgi:hypothetical protein